jgi:8-oxo-dGTP diphosphatase
MDIVALAIFLRKNKFTKKTKILLERRFKDEDNYANKWSIPGGHQEKNETIEQTLLREMAEELNVFIKDYEKICELTDIDPTSRKIFKFHVFLVKKYTGVITKTNEEKAIVWAEITKADKIKEMATKDKRIIKKLRDYLRNEKQ